MRNGLSFHSRNSSVPKRGKAETDFLKRTGFSVSHFRTGSAIWCFASRTGSPFCGSAGSGRFGISGSAASVFRVGPRRLCRLASGIRVGPRRHLGRFASARVGTPEPRRQSVSARVGNLAGSRRPASAASAFRVGPRRHPRNSSQIRVGPRRLLDRGLMRL